MRPTIEQKNPRFSLKSLEDKLNKSKIVKDIENLRECLDRMIESKEFNYDDILEVSRDLDCLITQYYICQRPV